jgi:hypothetical protein
MVTLKFPSMTRGSGLFLCEVATEYTGIYAQRTGSHTPASISAGIPSLVASVT